MNIRLGVPQFTLIDTWIDPATGVRTTGVAAQIARTKYYQVKAAEESQAKAVAKAYADAQEKALRDQYTAEVAAASAKGADDFRFSTWKTEAAAPVAAKPSLLPLAALAAAALYFWKG